MKDKIHPDYHEITVIMTDGTSYKTRSTYGKPGDTLNLEIDSRSHPAWTGGQQKLLDGGQLARFNKRFQGQGGACGQGRRKAGQGRETCREGRKGQARKNRKIPEEISS